MSCIANNFTRSQTLSKYIEDEMNCSIVICQTIVQKTTEIEV